MTKGELEILVAAHQEVLISHDKDIKKLKADVLFYHQALDKLAGLVKKLAEGTANHFFQVLDIIERKFDA